MMPHLPPDWRAALADTMASARLASLAAFVAAADGADIPVYPPRADRFRAFELTPLASVRVVILGQDPYHGAGQAHGLSFSVRRGVRVPPSLVNLFKELAADLGIARPAHGCLDAWARQGVLLLNTVLTVEAGRAASHHGRGWEAFTDSVIAAVAARDTPTVFVLWGAHARRKAMLIAAADRAGKHLVIESAHPSPLSARTGFFGSRPFSRANAFLIAHGRHPIDWVLPL